MTAARPPGLSDKTTSRHRVITTTTGHTFKLLSGGARGPLDPYQAAHESIGLWRKYLHTCFRNHLEVSRAFEVSERCARNWWEGANGPRLDKAMVAMALHPDAAAAILFPEQKAG